jgi:hypothetical protein
MTNYLEQNLAIMEKRDPELAVLMRSDVDCRHIEVLPSEQAGVLTARVTAPDGTQTLLHNMADPIGSARRTAERHTLKADNGSILLGLGLGYLAMELTKRLEKKHPLLICEVDPAVVKTALTYIDLSVMLDNDYVRIVTGADIPLEEWIARLSVKFMTAKVDVISYGPSVSTNPSAYQRLKDIAVKESRAIILNRNTTLKAGRRMMENILNNFPDVLRSSGVKNLENMFEGRPAVLVAAGPSLEKNIHLLREVDGRAVVIAADTTLRLLLPMGIVPDIVTTIDFNEKNFEKFANVPVPDDVALVYHPGTYYKSVEAFGGPRFTMSRVQNRIPAWLMQYVEDKGFIPSGTTVAHLSFFLARHMGCDPIVFIGQDLAFPNNRVHASNLSLWHINTAEMEMTEDIFGERVGTMSSFKHAVYHLEKAFKETKATIIDATEGGVRKEGAAIMRLRDAIDRHMALPPIPVKDMLRERSRRVEPARMEELLRELAFVSADLKVIEDECRDIVTVSRRLQRKIRARQTESEEFSRLSAMAERLTQNMDQHGRVLHLMGEHNFALELYMAQHAVAEIDEIKDEHERLTQQVERSLVFYPSVAKAAGAFRPALDRLIQRLKRGCALAAARDTDAAGWYRRAVGYRRIGDRLEAARCAGEALRLDPSHRAALLLQAELLLEGHHTAEALTMLTRLRALGAEAKRIDVLTRDAEVR